MGDNKNRAVKTSAAERELRIGQVQEMLLSGLKRYEIVRNCSTLWGVVSRVTDVYIAAATLLISTELDRVRPDLVSKLYSQYQLLYKKMLQAKDYRGATVVLEKMCQFVAINKHQLPADSEDNGMPALSIAFETVSRKTNDQYQEAEVIPVGEIPVKRLNA